MYVCLRIITISTTTIYYIASMVMCSFFCYSNFVFGGSFLSVSPRSFRLQSLIFVNNIAICVYADDNGKVGYQNRFTNNLCMYMLFVGFPFFFFYLSLSFDLYVCVRVFVYEWK